jgi:NTE family protein
MDADLVLEGGGVKGIALVGAISVLEDRGYRFHRVAGTSAGAIVGALVAADVRADRMRKIMATLDYLAFQDAGWLARLGAPGQALSLLVRNGIYEGDFFRGWLRDLLAEHDVRTFGDLRGTDPQTSLPANQDYRLVVMVSDISEGRLRHLPWDYERYRLDADAVEVVDAVRASMSIPYFYRPVKMRDHVSDADRWLVDGGMLSNFPVGVFDRRDAKTPRWPTFGLKLSGRPDALQGVPNEVRGVWSMTRAMVATMTSFYDRIHLDDPSVVSRTIFIDTLDVRATDFDIDERTQRLLFDNGRRAAEKFLDGGDGQPAWDFDAYLERFRPDARAEGADPA